MIGIQQSGILALQPQEPVNVPTPPEGSFYMFINIFDGIAYYKDHNKVCIPISNITGSLPNTQILIGNASSAATAVPVSGDLTVQNTGAFTVTGLKGIPLATVPFTAGTMLYYDSSIWQKLAPGSNGQVLTMVAGVPTWV